MELSSTGNPFGSPPVLDRERQQKARSYARIRRRLDFVEMGFSLVLLLVLTFTGISNWFTGYFNWPVPAVAAVFLLVLISVDAILTFPLSYYQGFVLSHRYGISRQNFAGWLADLAKGLAISLLFGGAAAAVVYWLLLAFPGIWWWLAWGLVLLVSLILSIVAPVILVPLFFKVRPLGDSHLKSRLEQLAEKAGARVQGIFILDFSAKMTAANAGLMGLGKTRRIVISDTLLQQYPPSEIEVVTAHEIGHHMNRDIFRLFIIQAAVYLAILGLTHFIFRSAVGPAGFSGLADPAALPLLLLIAGVLSALTAPLTNSFSRFVERQADAYALELTDDSGSFINAMTRLTNQNLSVADPSRWVELLFYDHPSYVRRVELARAYEEKHPVQPER
jgi:STE24 endopeptidase